jgi:hypothetical protein
MQSVSKLDQENVISGIRFKQSDYDDERQISLRNARDVDAKRRGLSILSANVLNQLDYPSLAPISRFKDF